MGMGHKEPLNDGEQWDAFTRWRKRLHWHPGELKKIKRRASKRNRKAARQDISSQHNE